MELSEQKAFIEWLSDVDDIDSTNSVVLNYFMSSPSAYVSSSARGLLVANNLMQYSEPYLVPDFTKKTDVRRKNNEKLSQYNSYVKVYPNPAKDYITIEYDLSKKEVKPYIYLLDQSGRLINSISIKKTQDQILVETKEFKPGTYYVQMIESGKRLGSCRFTIIK